MARTKWAAILGLMALVGGSLARGAEGDGWIALFNGTDKSGWHLRHADGADSWSVQDGALVNTPPPGEHGTDLISDLVFWNCELELDFMVPAMSENSGVYLRGRYEIQILGDYGRAPAKGGCGSIYNLCTASKNMSKKPGEWNHLRAVLVDDRVDVWMNGEQVIDGCRLTGPTGSELDRNEQLLGPIFLQGDHGRVAYKNIRVRPLDARFGEGWIQAFTGTDKSGWELLWKDREDSWKVIDGALANVKSGGNDLRTVDGDMLDQRVHLEFKVEPGKNSGVYFRGNYEVQIFGSYGNPSPGIHDCGAIYGKIAPALNGLTTPDRWQALDVVIQQDPEKKDVPWMQVVLNNRVVIPWQRIEKSYPTHPAITTGGPMVDDPTVAGPLRFQGDHDEVAYRNIWYRPLGE